MTKLYFPCCTATRYSKLRILASFKPTGAGYESVNYEINNTRNSTLKYATFLSLVFIGPILNEIQPFSSIHLVRNIQFLNSCILFNIGSIDTKLEIFRNFKVLFPLRGSRVVHPITNRLVPSPTRFETRIGN